MLWDKLTDHVRKRLGEILLGSFNYGRIDVLAEHGCWHPRVANSLPLWMNELTPFRLST